VYYYSLAIEQVYTKYIRLLKTKELNAIKEEDRVTEEDIRVNLPKLNNLSAQLKDVLVRCGLSLLDLTFPSDYITTFQSLYNSIQFNHLKKERIGGFLREKIKQLNIYDQYLNLIFISLNGLVI
jgi:hypothetical protein